MSLQLDKPSFANHLPRLFVIAHADESAMPKVPGVAPFHESQFRNPALKLPEFGSAKTLPEI